MCLSIQYTHYLFYAQKCVPCSRGDMDRELFDEPTVLNLVAWSLNLFVAYCAEYQHECTFVKKAKQYKDKLQQSIAQSKSLLHGPQ